MPLLQGPAGGLALLALLVRLTAGGGPTASGGEGNLLENPGFEAGSSGWSSLSGGTWGTFDVVEGRARTGRRAARLRLEAAPGEADRPIRVHGVVQEVSPAVFPEWLSGAYRVDRWRSDDPGTRLYLQVVVVVWDDPETARLVPLPAGRPPLRNYQLRYYLAGVAEPPFRLGNARGRVVEPGPPAEGEWVSFALPVRRDFEELWGRVPAGFDALRVLFEARWDQRPDGAAVQAEVLYDDLAFGSPR